ncbi:GNAT family N-acetyltransferase [Parabacteroides sp. AM08-6]|uniref:GNAT family N-acetyltransferase n=1 Tax=Parabacteroides sp. AM08-6 TaxID=2292053 RepID=UPI000EFE2658|nr:GNAT family N-acetyltransferase [Parabacteroides sp. AM08-6]RHJ85350.1 N-acetyltransferase [Parabacteroides sp. AM08-6]
MERTRITDTQSPLYPCFEQLYHMSSPIFEQRTEQQQHLAFVSQKYHLNIYTEGEIFIGFIAYWDFDDYLYVEHLAICPDLRGKGYGAAILKESEKEGKRLLLEIDPVIDDISAKRLHFYELNGFSLNPYPHIHPPYRKGFDAHRLVILTTRGELTQQEYERFNADLKDCVMSF